MTAQERKQIERQARRKRIIDAASVVFSDLGYTKTSIEQIGREAHLSVGAIYLYFRSKEDLAVSVFIENMQKLGPEVTKSPIFKEIAPIFIRNNLQKTLSEETINSLRQVWGDCQPIHVHFADQIGQIFVNNIEEAVRK